MMDIFCKYIGLCEVNTPFRRHQSRQSALLLTSLKDLIYE